jgi:hypothetical protein
MTRKETLTWCYFSNIIGIENGFQINGFAYFCELIKFIRFTENQVYLIEDEIISEHENTILIKGKERVTYLIWG